MKYEEIYKKAEEFCNSTTQEEYEKLEYCPEMEGISTELEEFLKENYEDLFWELVDTYCGDLILDPWQFIQDCPTEKDFILDLLDDIDTWTIAEWADFDLERNEIIKEYLFKNGL